MKTLPERIAEDGITAEVSYRSGPPAHTDWGNDASWYDVTLTFEGRTLTVPFGMGPAHTEGPTAADVLNCLLSDASSYENAGSFEEWAADLGFDTDSRKAEQTYNEVARQTSHLRAFLGDAYDAYLYDTEQL